MATRLFFEVGQIKPSEETCSQIADPFVEGNKHAGFVVVERAPDQKGRRQQVLPQPGAADQRRPPGGRPPPVSSSRPLCRSKFFEICICKTDGSPKKNQAIET